MLIKPMTCHALLPMHAALFAQWAFCLVLSGLTFVPLLNGCNISTLFSLGWLEVSMSLALGGLSCITNMLEIQIVEIECFGLLLEFGTLDF